MHLRRNPKVVLVGLVCLLAGAGGLMLAWQTVNTTQDVLVTTRDVAAGQVLAAEDVRVAHIGQSQGVAWWPSIKPVAGQVALADLPQGSPLEDGVLSQPPPAPTGMMRVSVVVGVGLAPVSVLPVGASVGLCGPDEQQITGHVASEPVMLPDGGRHRFDVLVAAGDAAALARWVADEALVVVKPITTGG